MRALAEASLAGTAHQDRLATVYAFIRAMVRAYWIELCGRHGVDWLFPATGMHETATLDESIRETAAAIGQAAAGLPREEGLLCLGATYSTLLPPEQRSRHGVFYTPLPLVERLLDIATEAGFDWTIGRVLDPACGGGAFLVIAARRMVEHFRRVPPEAALRQLEARLRGLEIDPFAAWLAQVCVEVAVIETCAAAGRRLGPVVETCDSLAVDPPARGFDLVVGNPPYGRIGLSPALRDTYARSLYGHANLYGVFTDLALRWCAADGLIAFVTPTSFLAGEYFKALRRMIHTEAPPAMLELVEARKGVFDDVLQETALTVFRKGLTAAPAQVRFLSAAGGGEIKVASGGIFRLPLAPTDPWLVPRQPGDARLVERARRMPARLVHYGYAVSTGPLVWNRHKDQLAATPDDGSGTVHPLVWAESVTADGRFVFRCEKRNHLPYFRTRPGDDWLVISRPCVLVQRTTAKEQARRLIAAALPKSFLRRHRSVVVENHLNMVRPTGGRPAIDADTLAAILNSDIVDRMFRCINGSVAVSAYELEALPLPAIDDLAEVVALVARGAAREEVERALAPLYLGSRR
jgi:adenine-specific DNA-methyltransferase